MKRLAKIAATIATFALPAAAAAQTASIDIGGAGDETLSGRAIQLVLLLTVLSIAPGILMTVTSFTRIVVALSLLRTGLGAPGVPPNPVLISLALFLSFFVMAPTIETAWDTGVVPFQEGQLTEEEAFERTAAPFEAFMMSQVRGEDLALFRELAETNGMMDGEDVGLSTLVPAFMISELRRAFEIGFLILCPFSSSTWRFPPC